MAFVQVKGISFEVARLFHGGDFPQHNNIGKPRRGISPRTMTAPERIIAPGAGKCQVLRMAKKTESKPAPQIETFGFPVYDGKDQLFYDMAAFIQRRPIELGALPRHHHFWRISDMMFGNRVIQKNPWTLRIIKALCHSDRTGLMGCAGASKTFSATYYAGVSWLCAPASTTVVMTSSTREMIKKRGWPVIQAMNTHLFQKGFGNFVDSLTEWQASRGDHKNAIHTIAVRQGSVAEAAGRIAGMHNRRIIVIIDEATDTPKAIFSALPNLRTGAADFQMIVIGNPRSRLDEFGRFCEPLAGWASLNIDTSMEWDANPYMSSNPTKVLRFDAEHSPNMIAGYDRWKGIAGIADTANKRAQHGKNSPIYYSQDRGFMPPDGVCRAVMSDTFFDQYGTREKLIFVGEIRKLSAMDPAFGGGDKACQSFGTLGMTDKGIMACQIDEYVYIDVNAMEKKTLHYQLAREAISNCKRRNVAPENFFIAAAAEGAGPASIITNEWSPKIVWIEEGGKASDGQVSPTDTRRRCDVYDRKVTEMWFTAKEFAMSGQIKGFSREAEKQFATREFEEVSGGRISLEKKIDYKDRIKESPDEADATALLTYGMHLLGVAISGTKASTTRRKEEKRVATVADDVYAGNGYTENVGDHPMFTRDEPSDQFMPIW